MLSTHQENTNTLLHNASAAHKKAWITSHIHLAQAQYLKMPIDHKDMMTKSDASARSTDTHFLAMPNSHKTQSLTMPHAMLAR